MKYLFVSLDGLIADIAWEVVKEGHDVKLCIHDQGEKEIADGFVPKSNDWEKEVDWADLIVFDDVLGQGTHAQRLRQAGKLVVGGTPYTDRLEDDRAFGQQELKNAGVAIIPRRLSRPVMMPSTTSRRNRAAAQSIKGAGRFSEVVRNSPHAAIKSFSTTVSISRAGSSASASASNWAARST
jgi:hypothetical protein